MSNTVTAVGLCMFLPTMLLGTTLSSAVLLAFAVYRKSLLGSLYERVNAAKTLVIFVWALSVSLRLILDVVNPAAITVTYQRIDAAVSFVSYLWLVVLNVLAALSRFLEFDDRKNSRKECVLYTRGYCTAVVGRRDPLLRSGGTLPS